MFAGGSEAPTVTINGTGLGTQPAPNPDYTPEGHPLCPVTPSGNQGYDYGSNGLYLSDTAHKWSAGRYRPDGGELDCIGLLVSQFTPTQVVFQLGSFYTKPQYSLDEGDTYELAVNGTVFLGTVHYTPR